MLLNLCQQHLLDRTRQLVTHVRSSSDSLEQRLELFFSVFNQQFANRDRLEKELIAFMLANFASHRDEGGHMHRFMVETYTELYQNDRQELADGLDEQLCAEMTVGMISNITMTWLNQPGHHIEERLKNLYQFINNTMLNSTRP